MIDKQSLPKMNLPTKLILVVACIACAIIYYNFIASNLSSGELCDFLAVDYCAYWSGGKLMADNSIADVYDMGLLRQYQAKIYPEITGLGVNFSELPLPYLPVFIVIFQPLSLIDLPYSFIVWTLINVLVFIFYLRFFVKELTHKELSNIVLILAVISLPVFLNFFYGQVNILLFICAGEFFRNLTKSNQLKAGFWLGGWLLKPQLLLFILPFLLIRKYWKTLLGFVISSLSLVLLSFGLVGKDGLLGLIDILMDSFQGGAASNAHHMMNWRMIGIYLTGYFNKKFGLSVVIAGSIITTIITFLVLSKKRSDDDDTYLCISLFGIFAATGAVTWHAHLSMSMVLIPLLFYLLITEKMNPRIFVWWVFAPIVLFFSRSGIDILMYLGLIPGAFNNLPDLFEALPGLIFNLLFLGWSVKHYRSPGLKTTSLSIDN